MNIAVFGGAFDPFTIAHLHITKEVAKMNFIDLLFIEPAHNLYKNIQTSYKHRYWMIEQEIKKHKSELKSKVYVGFFDSCMKRQPFTFETLDYYSNFNFQKNHNIYCVIGTDQLKVFNTWMMPKTLLKNYKWIVFERDNDDALEIIKINKLLCSYSYNFIIKKYGSFVSSSQIRQKLVSGKKTESVSKHVMNYIKTNDLYKK